MIEAEGKFETCVLEVGKGPWKVYWDDKSGGYDKVTIISVIIITMIIIIIIIIIIITIIFITLGCGYVKLMLNINCWNLKSVPTGEAVGHYWEKESQARGGAAAGQVRHT